MSYFLTLRLCRWPMHHPHMCVDPVQLACGAHWYDPFGPGVIDQELIVRACPPAWWDL